MDDRPLVWDRANREHLAQNRPERGISLSDVEEVLTDPARDERYDPLRDNHPVLSRTKAGRWLIVVWVHPRGRYAIHARPASVKVQRRWRKP